MNKPIVASGGPYKIALVAKLSGNKGLKPSPENPYASAQQAAETNMPKAIEIISSVRIEALYTGQRIEEMSSFRAEAAIRFLHDAGLIRRSASPRLFHTVDPITRVRADLARAIFALKTVPASQH